MGVKHVSEAFASGPPEERWEEVFRERLLNPTEEGREEQREGLVAGYGQVLIELREAGGDNVIAPSLQYMAERIDRAWAGDRHSERAAEEAFRLFSAALATVGHFKSLSQLKTKAHTAAKAAAKGKHGKLQTTGEALRAVARAYQATDTTMTARFSAAVMAVRSAKKLKTAEQEPRKPGRRQAAPWGRFAVRLDRGREQLEAEGPEGVRLLKAYPPMLEQHVVPAMMTEGAALQKVAEAAATTGEVRAEGTTPGGG